MISLTGTAQVCNLSAAQADGSVCESPLVKLTVHLVVLLLQTGGRA